MNLLETLTREKLRTDFYAGGPGSGCQGENCGRKSSGGAEKGAKDPDRNLAETANSFNTHRMASRYHDAKEMEFRRAARQSGDSGVGSERRRLVRLAEAHKDASFAHLAAARVSHRHGDGSAGMHGNVARSISEHAHFLEGKQSNA